METSFTIIQKLVDWVSQFTEDQKKSEFTIEEFIVWLNPRIFDKKQAGVSDIKEDDVNMELSFLLIFQNRHFKNYAKQALIDSDLSSPDSFSFLYHLSLVDSYRKMELVKMHMMEAPSGIEVLKRLLSKNLIEEFDDPDDGRAKRIRLTTKGKNELEQCIPLMNSVFKQMTGEMDLSQKLHFIGALKEINNFHSERKTQTKV